jgi:hypothetical protein
MGTTVALPVRDGNGKQFVSEFMKRSTKLPVLQPQPELLGARRSNFDQRRHSVKCGERGSPHTVIASAQGRSDLLHGGRRDCLAWGAIASLLVMTEGDVGTQYSFPGIALDVPRVTESLPTSTDFRLTCLE